MSALEFSGVGIDVGGRALVRGADLRVAPGELVALLGPNGAGKTSLMRAGCGLLRVAAGAVRIGGDDPRALGPAERGRRLAYLPQAREAAWPVRVRDAVALGRFAHGAAPGRLQGEDAEAVEAALAACALGALANRRIDTLSGGELARAHVARIFASRAPLALADEPAAALDPFHQFAVMALFRAYADRGGAVLVVMHDATLAARFADRLAWMRDGRILADGPPGRTLTPGMLAAVYGVRAQVLDSAAGPVVAVLGAGAPDGAK